MRYERSFIGICGLTIICCGITGDYCILTGWDNRPDNALAGLLLPAGGRVCGWVKGVKGIPGKPGF